MKRDKKYILIFLLIVSFALIVSCPAPSTNLIDTGSEPYQKPFVPQSVVATKGEKDILSISWNPVDRADLYIIEGIASSEFGIDVMQEYARTTDTSYTFYLNGSGDGKPYREFNTEESYIFTVKSYVNYGSADSFLISDSSDYAEGCFAPSSIEFYVSVTNSNINLYWNCSNIYSALSAGNEPEPLYIPDFTIEYRKSGEASWQQISKEQYGGSDPWMFASLNVSEYGFEHNAIYDFRISMSLTKDVSNGSTLQSNTLSVAISDDLSVNSVQDLSISKGTLSDRIKLSWKLPSWSQPVSRDNSYFRILRGVSDDISKAETIVDEISSMNHDPDIVESDGLITYEDKKAGINTQYFYWVIFGAADLDGLMHEQDKKEAASGSGFVFYPDISSLSAEWTPDNENKSSSVSFSWNNSTSVTMPDDLQLAIERSVWHSQFDRTVTNYIPLSSDSYSLTERTSECGIQCADNSGHRYEYNLVVLKDGNVLYELGSFEIENPVLGQIQTMPFKDFTASDDYVDTIRISWAPISGHENDQYSYSLDDGEYISFTPQLDGERMYHLIPVSDDGIHMVSLKAGEYIAPEPREGKRLSVQDISFSATDGTSSDSVIITWNSFGSYNGDIVYQMYADDSILGIINPEDGKYVVSSGSIKDKGETYQFRIGAYNKKQEGNPVLYFPSDEGYVLPVPTLKSVSKGDYSDKIIIEWDTSISDMIDGYEVCRSEKSDLSNSIVIATITDPAQGSYEDYPPYRDREYYYSVVSTKSGISSRHLSSAEIGSVTNRLFENEPANLGYIFDTSLTDVAVAESIESNNKFISDYFIVSVPANKTVRQYEISSELGENEIYSMDDIEDKGDGTYGRKDYERNAIGYFYYDKSTKLMYFNSAVGIVDESLSVSSVSVQGKGGLDYSIPTEKITANGSYRRGFGLYDYIRLFNKAFTSGVNSVKSKDSDWWEGVGQNKYENEQIVCGTVYGAFSQYAGYIYFINYSINGYSLSGEEDNRIFIHVEDGGTVLAPGVDPIDWIGFEDDSNKTTLHVDEAIVVNGTPVRYKDGDITVKNLCVRTGADNQGYGSYTIVREDGVTLERTIDSTDIEKNNVPDKP